MRFRATSLLFAVGFAGFGLFAASRVFMTPNRDRPQTEPPILQQIQALGDLHTVKYTYRDVNSYSTKQKPVEWLSAIPGTNEVVDFATRNTALMTYTGTVEAGVDLTLARVARRPYGLEIVLPQPRLYPPNVTADVEDLQRGLVWRDKAIATDAIEDAKRRFREASLQQGILKEAKKNARMRILKLARDMSPTPVTVTFDRDPA